MEWNHHWRPRWFTSLDARANDRVIIGTNVERTYRNYMCRPQTRSFVCCAALRVLVTCHAISTNHKAILLPVISCSSRPFCNPSPWHSPQPHTKHIIYIYTRWASIICMHVLAGAHLLAYDASWCSQAGKTRCAVCYVIYIFFMAARTLHCHR